MLDMKSKLPFSILYKNKNLDFFFDLHPKTVNHDKVGEIASILLNKLDVELKNGDPTSDGDLIQALALFIAARIEVSNADNDKILNFFSDTLSSALKNINSGKVTKIGNS